MAPAVLQLPRARIPVAPEAGCHPKDMNFLNLRPMISKNLRCFHSLPPVSHPQNSRFPDHRRYLADGQNQHSQQDCAANDQPSNVASRSGLRCRTRQSLGDRIRTF